MVLNNQNFGKEPCRKDKRDSLAFILLNSLSCNRGGKSDCWNCIQPLYQPYLAPSLYNCNMSSPTTCQDLKNRKFFSISSLHFFVLHQHYPEESDSKPANRGIIVYMYTGLCMWDFGDMHVSMHWTKLCYWSSPQNKQKKDHRHLTGTETWVSVLICGSS